MEKLGEISTISEVASTVVGRSICKVSLSCLPPVLPEVECATYNVGVGDLACGWEVGLIVQALRL